MRLVVSPEDSMPTGEELDEGLRRALARMASVGVTTFHDMFVTPVVIDSYRRLLDRGELPLRPGCTRGSEHWRASRSATTPTPMPTTISRSVA